MNAPYVDMLVFLPNNDLVSVVYRFGKRFNVIYMYFTQNRIFQFCFDYSFDLKQ